MQQSLRAWRESVGLTQMRLAAESRTTPAQISVYENGHRAPEYETALRLVAALRAAGAKIASVEDVEFAAVTAARNSDSAA